MRSVLMTILIAGLCAGCGEKQDDKAGDGCGEIEKGIDKGMDDVKKDAEKGMDDAKKGVEDANDATGDMVEKAKTMLADAMKAITDGKSEEAKGLLGKLDAMKASLPEDLQKQIADAWKALKAKDAVGGLIPK